MNMASNLLATLAGSYQEEDPLVSYVKERREKPVKVAKARKAKASNDGAQAAPKDERPVVLSIPLPATRPLSLESAKSFIIERRQAGKVWSAELNRLIFDERQVRDMAIVAIAGFCGYDRSDNFGAQDQRAIAKAQNLINPCLPGKDRTVRPTVEGFIAGAPDHKVKMLQNLEARERLAIDGLCDHEKAALAAANDLETRLLHETAAKALRVELVDVRQWLEKARAQVEV